MKNGAYNCNRQNQSRSRSCIHRTSLDVRAVFCRDTTKVSTVEFVHKIRILKRIVAFLNFPPYPPPKEYILLHRRKKKEKDKVLTDYYSKPIMQNWGNLLQHLIPESQWCEFLFEVIFWHFMCLPENADGFRMYFDSRKYFILLCEFMLFKRGKIGKFWN